MIIRQNGSYTHGSSSSATVSPSSIYFYQRQNFIAIDAAMSNTTNATNNDACGILLSTGSLLTIGKVATASTQSNDDPDTVIEAGPAEEVEP